MKGLLLIDKPAGWTSFDVVNYIRKIVARLEGKKPKQVKVGHTGTLDPAATGLLVIAVGKEFTSQMPVLMKQDKTYEVEVTLGITSSTGDSEGELKKESSSVPTEDEVDKTLKSFIGTQQQTPPQYSALKVKGVPAYKLARAGKQAVLSPRTVTVYDIADSNYHYPKITFRTSVSSGTYIRTLAEDIGRNLGTGAYMSALRRVAIGEYSLEQALVISELTEERLQKTLAA